MTQHVAHRTSDEIAQLRAEAERAADIIAELVAALEPFAELVTAEEARWENAVPPDLATIACFIRDMRRARAAVAHARSKGDE